MLYDSGMGKKQTYDFFKRQYLKLVISTGAVLLFSLLLGVSVKTVLLMALLILLASFSTFYFNYVVVPVNFELVKMSTILAAYTHGIAAGLIVGISSTILGKVLIGRIDDKLPISVAAISLLAVAAGLFSGADIVVLGILLVGFYNIAVFSLTHVMGGDIMWNLPYEGTNFVFNFILFARIAPLLLPLLQ